MRNERNLDELLDRALSAYTEREPQLGLEARVLRKAHAPHRLWFWLAIPALAALALAVMLPRKPHPDTQPEKYAIVAEVGPSSSQTVPVARKPARKPRPASGPTDQQLALATLVRDYPELAIPLTHEAPQPLTVEPLAMEPISINALDQ